jgi:hypothetical protein
VNDSITTTTLTFPSGDTVELPDGMLPCTTPEAVTRDPRRYTRVGTTASGRPILSAYSCAAYDRAHAVLSMRRAVARKRARADELEADGLTIKARKLRGEADRQEAAHGVIIRAWAAYPAPCTCLPKKVDPAENVAALPLALLGNAGIACLPSRDRGDSYITSPSPTVRRSPSPVSPPRTRAAASTTSARTTRSGTTAAGGRTGRTATPSTTPTV